MLLSRALRARPHPATPTSPRRASGNIALAGIFLSLAFYTPGGMWTAFGAHLGWNATLAALAAPVSGLPFDIPYIDYRAGRPGLAHRRPFGPEGGLLGTVAHHRDAILVAGAGYERTRHESRRRGRGGHHGQRDRPRLRAARLGGGADRQRARRAGEGHGDDPEQPRPPGEEGHASARRAGSGARPDRDRHGARARRPAPRSWSRRRARTRRSSSPLFEQLDRIAAPEAILATNTSSISITEIAARTRRPEQVIGMHFMNPVPVMQLVEVIRGHATSDATTRDGDGDRARRWARRRSR